MEDGRKPSNRVPYFAWALLVVAAETNMNLSPRENQTKPTKGLGSSLIGMSRLWPARTRSYFAQFGFQREKFSGRGFLCWFLSFFGVFWFPINVSLVVSFYFFGYFYFSWF